MKSDKTLIILFAEIEKMDDSDQLTIRSLLEAVVMKNKLNDMMTGRQV